MEVVAISEVRILAAEKTRVLSQLLLVTSKAVLIETLNGYKWHLSRFEKGKQVKIPAPGYC